MYALAQFRFTQARLPLAYTAFSLFLSLSFISLYTLTVSMQDWLFLSLCLQRSIDTTGVYVLVSVLLFPSVSLSLFFLSLSLFFLSQFALTAK